MPVCPFVYGELFFWGMRFLQKRAPEIEIPDGRSSIRLFLLQLKEQWALFILCAENEFLQNHFSLVKNLIIATNSLCGESSVF